jgi:ActR/RegA family two-component response regulator
VDDDAESARRRRCASPARGHECEVAADTAAALGLVERVGGVPGAVDAMKRGAFQYVTKPCDLE